MTKNELRALSEHADHDVEIADYKVGEPFDPQDKGRFCLECLDCGEIILGSRVMVGSARAISVTG